LEQWLDFASRAHLEVECHLAAHDERRRSPATRQPVGGAFRLERRAVADP
jgi:hypothetical protein